LKGAKNAPANSDLPGALLRVGRSVCCNFDDFGRIFAAEMFATRPRFRWYRPDLNSEQDRAYLIGRGFTYAVSALAYV